MSSANRDDFNAGPDQSSYLLRRGLVAHVESAHPTWIVHGGELDVAHSTRPVLRIRAPQRESDNIHRKERPGVDFFAITLCLQAPPSGASSSWEWVTVKFRNAILAILLAKTLLHAFF
jgi:hypothetical protein